MAELGSEETIRYRRTATLGTLVPLVLLSVSSALQSELFQVARDLAAYDEIYAVPLWARLVANLSASATLFIALWTVPIRAGSRRFWYLALIGGAIVAVLIRAALQLLFGVYLFSQIDLVAVDVLVALILALFSLTVGVFLSEALARARAQGRAASRQALRARSALDALQAEELRVRREVAEALHGTVQQRLVILSAQLRAVLNELPEGVTVEAEHRNRLVEIEQAINDLREQDVRGMGQLLHPEGVNLGLAQAVRMMLRRVPSAIRVQTEIHPTVAEYDEPGLDRIPQDIRLLTVRVLEEAISNALRHGHAATIAVTVTIEDEQLLRVVVDDDGSGVPENAVLSGLDQLHQRLERVGGMLALGRGALGGAGLKMTIPLSRSSRRPAA